MIDPADVPDVIFEPLGTNVVLACLVLMIVLSGIATVLGVLQSYRANRKKQAGASGDSRNQATAGGK